MHVEQQNSKNAIYDIDSADKPRFTKRPEVFCCKLILHSRPCVIRRAVLKTTRLVSARVLGLFRSCDSDNNRVYPSVGEASGFG